MKDHYYQSIEGWFDFEDLYRRMVEEAPAAAHFVEVGVWMGKSLSFLAVEAANSGKAITLDGVDSWEGSVGEPNLQAVARRHDVMAYARHHVGLSGHPVHLARGQSPAAAAAYPDGSLDFVFIDASHDYPSVRADLSAWLPKVRWGGHLGGHDYAGEFSHVALAVRDFLPLGELEILKSSWLWKKQAPRRGRWLNEPAAADWLIYLPHVAGEDVLRAAVNSLGADARARAVVIDQSEAGLDPAAWPTAGLFRWEGPVRFTTAMNWMQRDACYRGLWCYLFMHSDAECASPAAVGRVLDRARRLEDEGPAWSVIFTNYDAVACFNTKIAHAVGCWDESFAWYVADVDYYNRLRWHGWRQVCLPEAGVLHRGSSTLPRLASARRGEVDADTRWAHDHYRHKWGVGFLEHPDGRRFAIPYDGRG